MFRNKAFGLALVMFLLSACANAVPLQGINPQDRQETPAAPATEQPDDAANEDPATPEVQEPVILSPADWQVGTEDQKLQRGEVFLDRMDLLTLESFPPQFRLLLAGYKGDPCRVVRIVVGVPDEQRRIDVDVYTLFDPAALCIQVVDEFETTVPLEGYEAGEYSVFVNGREVGSMVVP